jgi:6-phosphogluconate dehydrogenase
MAEKSEFGMVGLGTMGSNLVMNMCDHHYNVSGYDKDVAKGESLIKNDKTGRIKVASKLEDFMDQLSSPRIIMMLVPAGKIVDAVITDLRPFLDRGDIVIDCGNSHFTDTVRRVDALSSDGIHFMGIGVSGGELGARFGPAIMPGGDKAAYNKVSKMLEDISAKYNGHPCTAYMGEGAAGHYVKMVHNGIEYALMELLAETYHILKIHGGLSNKEMHDVFSSWNEGRLESYLVAITAAILLEKDSKTDKDLIDVIADKAKQKGTGAWTSVEAMGILSPTPAIDAAVTQRVLSSMKEERVAAAVYIGKTTEPNITKDREKLLEEMESALYASFLITYAQGLAMLQKGSITHGFNTDIASVASIWRAGCIIRAELLNEITNEFKENHTLTNLMLAPSFTDSIKTGEVALRKIIGIATAQSIPCGTFCALLNYHDSYFSAWLPANMIQAHRDFFGAHTYERLDMEGAFHTEWTNKVQ